MEEAKEQIYRLQLIVFLKFHIFTLHLMSAHKSTFTLLTYVGKVRIYILHIYIIYIKDPYLYFTGQSHNASHFSSRKAN